MDEIIVSLEVAQQRFLDSIGLDQAASAIWLWVSLGSFLLLLVYLAVRFLVGRRGRRASALPKGLEIPSGGPDRPDRVDSGVAEGVAAAEPVAQERVTAPPLLEESEESLFERLRGRLARTHDQLIGRLDQILLRPGVGKGDLLEELEEILGCSVMITADPLLHHEKFDLA